MSSLNSWQHFFIFTVSRFYLSPSWKIFCINSAMMDGNFIGYLDLILLPVINLFILMSVLHIETGILFAYINNVEYKLIRFTINLFI